MLFSYTFRNLFFFCYLLLSSTTVPQYQSRREDDGYVNCHYTYNCGNFDIPYPFWGENRPGYCGRDGFKVKCLPSNLPSIQIGSQNFTLTGINQDRWIVKMVRTDIPSYDNCSFHFTNTSLDPSLFSFDTSVVNMTLFYDCDPGISIGQNNITCMDDSKKQAFFVMNQDHQSGRLFTEISQHCGIQLVAITMGVTVDPFGGIESLRAALDMGFDVQYLANWSYCSLCMQSGGICGSVRDNGSLFSCHCRDGSYDFVCPNLAKSSSNSKKELIIIGFTSGATATLLICITIFRCKIRSLRQKIRFWKTSKVDQQMEAFIRNQEPLALTRYRFEDVKKMTKSFQVKLGEGGYGTVYKGKLLNGCPVAVKMLNPSKGNGEEFVNEVASISRTSHVNVVSLLGFCLEGEKKALVYEFMHNGSLDKFIRNKENKTNSSLTWEKLYQIAIGTARGLEYLHRGCNTRILHFDIKPHNILLDESFCPKITDFGLAKCCPKRRSVISLSEARGTLGYLAPEVWNRNIGGVSYKSDVYSYGVMLIDMVEVQKNISIEPNDPTDENYVLDSIYDKLEQGVDLGGASTKDQENGIAKRMTIVGLWCMQTFPTQRPTMSRVIEMLEGSLDSLPMPPKPVMLSAQEKN